MVSNEAALPKALKVMAIAVFGLAVLLLGIYFVRFSDHLSTDQAVWGQFGDYVGGILNPLLSIPAFFAILYTIKLQANTVRMQSQQIKDASDAFELQAAHSETTFFDNRLFQLIDLHQKVLAAIEVYPIRIVHPGQDRGQAKPFMGDRGIGFLWHGFLKNQLYGVSKGNINDENYEAIKQAFNSWKASYWKHIGKYIKNFANVLSYVSMSYGRPEKWNFAIDVVRANLSQDEQNILFYFLVFSNEFDGHISMFISGDLLSEKDPEDPFFSEREDFLYRKASELLLVKPGV